MNNDLHYFRKLIFLNGGLIYNVSILLNYVHFLLSVGIIGYVHNFKLWMPKKDKVAFSFAQRLRTQFILLRIKLNPTPNSSSIYSLLFSYLHSLKIKRRKEEKTIK